MPNNLDRVVTGTVTKTGILGTASADIGSITSVFSKHDQTDLENEVKIAQPIRNGWFALRKFGETLFTS